MHEGAPTRPPRLGDVHDQGALAIYWPDTHPCGPTPDRDGRPWVMLHDHGAVSFAEQLRPEPDGSSPSFLGNIQAFDGV